MHSSLSAPPRDPPLSRRPEAKSQRERHQMAEASPEGVGQTPPPEPAARKGKSCKGCLYYSSVLKSRGYNPVCLGIPRSIPQVPTFVAEEPEMEATKEGRDLSVFKYACAGYSMFVDNKDNSSGEKKDKTLLPYCVGIELLVDRRTSTSDQASAHVHKEGVIHSQRQRQRPGHFAGQEFLERFERSAGLVASGVAKNVNKMANYIKESIDNVLYPYRRPPK